MTKDFKDFITKQDSLEKILFWVSTLMVFLASFISALSSIIENLSITTVIFCAASCASIGVIALIAQLTKKISMCYVLLCMWMCTAILPLQFFMYGAFNSSLIIYFFGAVFLCSLHSNKKLRKFLVIYALAVFEVTFILSWFHPEWATKIDEQTTFIDYCATFLLLSIALTSTTSYLMNVYTEDLEKKKLLFKKLEYLSQNDPLTDLYNRRYFINYLATHVWPNKSNYFVYMYDIDNFKKINDTYGHPFGDVVLREVAKISHFAESKENGECAVRYGGEEFIHLIRANTMQEAFAKAEFIRNGVNTISFDDKPEMRISISGGLVACADPTFQNQNKMLSGVDSLLYKAKAQGKNQTCIC